MLSLPVADTARLARPDLNPGIEGLRIERIAMVAGKLRSRHETRRRRAEVGDTGGGSDGLECGLECGLGRDLGVRLLSLEIGFELSFGFGGRFGDGVHGVAAAIDGDIERTRRKSRRRAKRFRRKNRGGKVESEELVGTVFVRDRETAPCQRCRETEGDESVLGDHRGLLNVQNSNRQYLGRILGNSSGSWRQGYCADAAGQDIAWPAEFTDHLIPSNQGRALQRMPV